MDLKEDDLHRDVQERYDVVVAFKTDWGKTERIAATDSKEEADRKRAEYRRQVSEGEIKDVPVQWMDSQKDLIKWLDERDKHYEMIPKGLPSCEVVIRTRKDIIDLLKNNLPKYVHGVYEVPDSRLV